MLLRITVMSLRHRLPAIALAMLLAIAGMLACTSDAPTPTLTASPSPSPSATPDPSATPGKWMGVRDSRGLSGPTLVTGRLVDADGQGVSAHVYAVAWPTSEVLGELGEGDPVNTKTVAWTTSGADGTFTLRVDPSVSLAEYTEANGTVNFDVRASDGSLGGAFFFPRQLNAETMVWTEPGSSGQPEPVTVRMEPLPSHPGFLPPL
jgi:hypothetical protein